MYPNLTVKTTNFITHVTQLNIFSRSWSVSLFLELIKNKTEINSKNNRLCFIQGRWESLMMNDLDRRLKQKSIFGLIFRFRAIPYIPPNNHHTMILNIYLGGGFPSDIASLWRWPYCKTEVTYQPIYSQFQPPFKSNFR
jgi:hypothetical protein